VPGAQPERGGCTAGERGEGAGGVLLRQGPCTGVGDPQVVAGLLALGPGLGVSAADEFDRAGLPQVDVDGDGVVAPRGVAGERERVAVALPFDRLDWRDLLQAVAAAPVQARAYLEGVKGADSASRL
jgi:hypothetical protein